MFGISSVLLMLSCHVVGLYVGYCAWETHLVALIALVKVVDLLRCFGGFGWLGFVSVCSTPASSLCSSVAFVGITKMRDDSVRARRGERLA